MVLHFSTFLLRSACDLQSIMVLSVTSSKNFSPLQRRITLRSGEVWFLSGPISTELTPETRYLFQFTRMVQSKLCCLCLFTWWRLSWGFVRYQFPSKQKLILYRSSNKSLHRGRSSLHWLRGGCRLHPRHPTPTTKHTCIRLRN